MLKIVLGTAQFGLDYGITNVKGKVKFEEVLAIKEYALKNGITMVDTAQNYGNSERILSNFQSFEIITKINLSQISSGNFKSGILLDNIKTSLNILGRQSLYALLIHDPVTLLGGNKDFFLQELNIVKKTGLVQKYGISCTPQKSIRNYRPIGIDLVQLPMNILIKDF